MSFDNNSALSQWQSLHSVSFENSSRSRSSQSRPIGWDTSVSFGSAGHRIPFVSDTAGYPFNFTASSRDSPLPATNSNTGQHISSSVLARSSEQRFIPSQPRPISRGSALEIQTGGRYSSSHSVDKPTAYLGSRTASPSASPYALVPGERISSGTGVGGGGGFRLNSRAGTLTLLTSVQNHALPGVDQAEGLNSASPTISSSPSVSSLSKISATQIVLLLDTISGKEGQATWESKAEKARSLLDANGQEVFSPFLRRGIVLNHTTIFHHNRDAVHGSYKLIQERICGIRTSFTQALRIVEAIETAKDDLYRDFDLYTFITHFLSDSVSIAVLAVAFTASTDLDLRQKAAGILHKIAGPVLQVFRSGGLNLPDLHSQCVASVLSHYGADRRWNSRCEPGIIEAIAFRAGHTILSEEIMSASQLWRMPDADRALIDALKKAGPKSTSSKAAVEDVLAAFGRDRLSDVEVAHALLFMIFHQPPQQYNVQEFVGAAQSHKHINWNNVIKAFDIPNVHVTADTFARLFNALLQVSAEDDKFDIQKLWGGIWQNQSTQVSFLRAFLLAPSKDVRIDKIPRLRSCWNARDYQGFSSEEIKKLQSKFEGQFMSLDAVQAIVSVALEPDQFEGADAGAILDELVSHHMDAFTLSLHLVSRQLGLTQETFVERCFALYLEKRHPDSDLILRALFKQSPEFTLGLCTMCFHSDPKRTEIIYERAEELGWTDTFMKAIATPLALDLACLRHKSQSDFDLEKYISDAVEGQSQMDRIQYGNTLWKYLRIKSDDEFRGQREQMPPQSVPLSLKSVFTLLWKLQDLVSDREILKSAQTTCLQTYPRLMNYGTGFDDVLEARSIERGNKLPEEIDLRMSELFGRMYRDEITIREMVTEMSRLKTSHDPDMQDLFCCIVHGLFDEYICYSEYPEDALRLTALLFGSIIRFRLLPPIPQEYGLTLIVDAVRDNPEQSAMYRFGFEALLQINERLPEWPSLCQQLLIIPPLQNTEIAQKAREGVQQSRDTADGNGTNGSGDTFAANGAIDDSGKDGFIRPFRSVHAESPSSSSLYRDPDQKAQEKILFVINNLSKDNMESKLSDLQDVLKPEHYQWFASYLVEQRARLEPNNQQMYFEFLALLDDQALMAEVVRETYVSVMKMMNAKATAESATERSHLKNLGGWLGSLTLAQNRPIRHSNIYFVDLLLEGYDTQRLVVVIPFTCKVLVQGAKSVVFRPPNPWLMEIVHLLLELYHSAELKLNLKFEIEVLCKDLSLDHKKIQPASVIRERPRHVEDELTHAPGIPDNLGDLEDFTLNGPMSRGVRERISPEEIMASLPNLREVLRYPQLHGDHQDQLLVKQMITQAFEKAILEIIAPVVERSITIASISTAQLVAKDYALEIDVEKYRNAARQMVKSLAGSLALVTCKEPLRMSVSNFIRTALDPENPQAQRISDRGMPSEGQIMMALNDNLDVACSFVEQAAEDRAIPEIDHVIEQELEERRRFAAEHPDRHLYNPHIAHWASLIPEPFKQVVGGLNESQRAVYEDFDRRVNGMNSGHIQNASTDSTGRQIPDVLQEPPSMLNLSTPAEQPVLPHQSPLTQQGTRAHSALQQPRVNGFPDALAPHDRIAMLIDEVQKAARISNAARIKEVEKNSSIFADVRQILIILTSSSRPTADHIARQIAEKICNTFIVKPPQNPLEAELLAFLLHKLCLLSELIVRDVMRWTTAHEEALLGNSYVTAALVSVGLMDLARIDGVIATALREHNDHGLQLLVELMEQTLFNDEPIALRADFANSIVALYAWLQEQPDLHPALEISHKLKARGVPEFVTTTLNDKSRAKQDQMVYVFKEWVALYENVPYSESAYGVFLTALHRDQIISSAEDLVNFLRLSIDSCVDCFESEAQSYRGSLTSALSRTDALAQLIVLLVKFQGDDNGTIRRSKGRYFESVLDLLVLVLNHHHEMRLTSFNQRVFTRLLNAMLYELVSAHAETASELDSLLVSFARTMLALRPSIFPGFAYGWCGLISNRILVDGLIKSADTEATNLYRTLLGKAFEFLETMIETDLLGHHYETFYRGLCRTLFVLQHDYPDFISENHVYLCARIPYRAPQLRNLVLTARPRAWHSEPDPFGPGFKIEHVEDIEKRPAVPADIAEPLERAGILDCMAALSRKAESIDNAVRQLSEAVSRDEETANGTQAPSSSVIELYEHVVAWLVNGATASRSKFDENAPAVEFLHRLFKAFTRTSNHAGVYYLISAIADHLRFPNAQTEYSLKLFLNLWGSGSTDQDRASVREKFTRVLLERLVHARPHPWGMVVAFQELSLNPMYQLQQSVGLGGDRSDLLQKLQAAVSGH